MDRCSPCGQRFFAEVVNMAMKNQGKIGTQQPSNVGAV